MGTVVGIILGIVVLGGVIALIVVGLRARQGGQDESDPAEASQPFLELKSSDVILPPCRN